jgi:hypothetical protein
MSGEGAESTRPRRHLPPAGIGRRQKFKHSGDELALVCDHPAAPIGAQDHLQSLRTPTMSEGPEGGRSSRVTKTRVVGGGLQQSDGQMAILSGSNP